MAREVGEISMSERLRIPNQNTHEESPELASFLQRLNETNSDSEVSLRGNVVLERQLREQWQELQQQKLNHAMYASHDDVVSHAAPGENMARLGFCLGFIGVLYCLGVQGLHPFGVLLIIIAAPLFLCGIIGVRRNDKEERANIRRRLAARSAVQNSQRPD